MLLKHAFGAMLVASLVACTEDVEQTRPLPDQSQPAPGTDVIPGQQQPDLGQPIPLEPTLPERTLPEALPPVLPEPHDPDAPPADPIAPPPGLGETDREFLSKAALGGLFEVHSSQLALEQASDPTTIEFAQMMIDDHSKANDRLRQIARTKGVDVPQDLDAEHTKLIGELQNLKDADTFALRYHEIQMKAHEDAIKLFEDASAEATDPDIATFAEETLPTLRKHLDHLRAHKPGD